MIDRKEMSTISTSNESKPSAIESIACKITSTQKYNQRSFVLLTSVIVVKENASNAHRANQTQYLIPSGQK